MARSVAYIAGIEFEWDEAKNDACLALRGFGFPYAAYAFLDERRVVDLDQRQEYGEIRLRLLGAIRGRVFVVIYTMRGSTIRIISAHKANRREVRKYGQNSTVYH